MMIKRADFYCYKDEAGRLLREVILGGVAWLARLVARSTPVRPRISLLTSESETPNL
jgi:hypothetical protein